MRAIFGHHLAAFAVATFLLVPGSKAVVWDDFQSYQQFQKIATGYVPQADSISRWGRFGAGTADDPVAQAGLGPMGETVGDYPLVWGAAGANNGNLVYHFPTPTNLTTTPGFSIQLMTSYDAYTNTIILAVFQTSSGAIWQTTAQNAQHFAESGVWQTNQFVFSPTTMELVDGTGAFNLSSISNIRIRFYNPSADGSSQHILFFDFQSVPPQPVIGALTLGAGNEVNFTFTTDDEVPVESFTVESASSLGTGVVWAQDANATIQSLGAGSYKVTTTRAASGTQFYRIKR